MSRTYGDTSQQLAVRGVAGLLFGVATLVWPHMTLWALVLLWGAFAIVDGVIALAAASGDPLLPQRGWVALRGVSGIVAGIVTFVWPSITAHGLLFVIAAWAFVTGGSLIVVAIRERKRLTGEWLIGLAGVASVVLGVVLVVTPGDGALAITWAIGWWAALYGGLSLWLSWALRHEPSGLGSWHGLHSARPGHATS